jgi:hypothetical protein
MLHLHRSYMWFINSIDLPRSIKYLYECKFYQYVIAIATSKYMNVSEILLCWSKSQTLQRRCCIIWHRLLQTIWDLRFSQWSVWQLLFSGMWHSVVWYKHTTLEEAAAFTKACYTRKQGYRYRKGTNFLTFLPSDIWPCPYRGHCHILSHLQSCFLPSFP